MIRRFGARPEPDRRYRLRTGVYALLPREGALLLTVQPDLGPDLLLPGGGIDPGEQPLRALHREIDEETGWRIDRPRRLGAFRRFTYMPEYDLWAEKLCHVYLAHPVRRLGPPREPGHRTTWVPVAEAVRYLANEGDRWFARWLLPR